MLNANVMYELGIRHAFDLPCVVTAQVDQKLPFDIQEHRIIRKDRTFATVEWFRQELERFSRAALDNGDYFRPMRQVRQSRLVDEVARGTKDDALAALSEQMKLLRYAVESRTFVAPATSIPFVAAGEVARWRPTAEFALIGVDGTIGSLASNTAAPRVVTIEADPKKGRTRNEPARAGPLVGVHRESVVTPV